MKYPNRLHLMVSDAQFSALEKESRKTGASMAELVRRAIEKMFKIGGKP